MTDWIAVSVLATLVVSGAPLLLTAVLGHGKVAAAEHRRGALVATVMAWVAIGVWFWIDRHAVMAGQRTLLVAGVNAFVFVVLFFSYTVPVMALPVERREAPVLRPASRRSVNAAHTIAALVVIAATIALWRSPNDVGYRWKGALLILAGIALYGLELKRLQHRGARSIHRGVAFILVCEVAAILTLTLDFADPLQRWLGVSAQLVVGVIGLIACAQLLKSDVRDPNSTLPR